MAKNWNSLPERFGLKRTRPKYAMLTDHPYYQDSSQIQEKCDLLQEKRPVSSFPGFAMPNRLGWPAGELQSRILTT